MQKKNIYLMGDPLWFFNRRQHYFIFFLTILDYMCLVSLYIFSSTMHIKNESLFFEDLK
jgi:hypothetical protein